MKLETFFEKFEQFADAPGAVGRMRELVLGLAIKGKLVNQHPNEGLATELVSRASAIRAKLIAEKKQRKPRAIQPVAEFDRSEIPSSWTWTTLNEITEIGPRNDVDNSTLASFLPMPAIPQQYGGKLLGELRPWSELKKGFTHLADGDIALAKITPCFQNGKSAVIEGLENGIGAGTTELHVARPFAPIIEPYYVWVFLSSPQFLLEGIPHMTGSAGQKRVPRGYFACKPFPLPPLAEQKRIVAKVDELMALCDRLEAQQQERDTRHAALARASLARFADAPTPANLLFLFHKSYDIDPAELRKSILTLAVQGKLVPQDPSDEPAEVLLEVLKSKQTALFLKEGLRKRKPVTGLDRSEWPSEFPATWAFPCFDDVMVIVSGVTKGRKLGGRQTITLPYLRVANVQRGYLILDVVKEIEALEEDRERYGLVAGDVLMTEGGDWDKLGRAAIWNEEIADCIHQNPVYRVRCADKEKLLPAWITLFVNSPHGRAFFADASKQTTNLASINMTQLRGCPLPLPPLAEQGRIVAKVDQLMALVDELETQLTASRVTAKNLLEALVAELTAVGAPSPEVPA